MTLDALVMFLRFDFCLFLKKACTFISKLQGEVLHNQPYLNFIFSFKISSKLVLTTILLQRLINNNYYYERRRFFFTVITVCTNVDFGVK